MRWAPNGTPFCWQPKEAFERIEQRIEEAASAKLVYLALTRIACNEGPIFTKPINYIAKLASLNRRTVERRLHDLAALKLVSMERLEGGMYRYQLATLSRNLTTPSREVTTRTRPFPVAPNRDIRERGEEAPLTTAQRIGLEKQLAILRGQLREIEADTADQWAKDAHPELLKQKSVLRGQIADIERRLL